MAFNVGKPETHTHTETVVTRGKTPIKTTVLSVEPKAQAEGNRLNAWLDARLLETFQQFQHEETTTTTRQKRLSAGMFPGAGELVYSPRQTPCGLGTFARHEIAWTLMGCGFIPVCATIGAVMFEPFASWRTDCETGWQRVEHDKNAPKSDVHLYSHLGLLGFHKTVRETRTGPVRDGPDRKAGTKEEVKTVAVEGPYELEWQIAGTDVSGKTTVGAGRTKATFVLPEADASGRYEVMLTFRSPYAGTGDAIRRAWTTRTLKQQVWLQAKPKPKPVETYVPPMQMKQPQIVERVVEKHYVHEVEKKPEGAPYNVEKAVDGAGRTVWRVAIRHGHLTAFDVDREVKEQILQELRDDFAGRNPDMPRGEINAFATYTTEDGGRTLVYVGQASSLIPALENLSYSAEQRRGTVTMRLAGGGADLRRSKEFVRQNISAIVCDKNVMLTAGERPPDGAKYRSLDENFSGGVLTVEFEAVE